MQSSYHKIVHKIHVINEFFYVRIISQQIWQPEQGYLLMQQIFLSQQMGVGVGVLVTTINQVCGSFYLSNAITGHVWIIPAFRIACMLSTFHVSSWTVANISESSLLFSQYRLRPCWGVVNKFVLFFRTSRTLVRTSENALPLVRRTSASQISFLPLPNLLSNHVF